MSIYAKGSRQHMLKRHITVLLVGLALALSLVALPKFTASARKFSFVQDGNKWIVTVTMCINGFKVEASGKTAPGVITEIRVDQVNKLLPNEKPPFIQLTQPLEFVSGHGSNLIASAPVNDIPVVGTGSFYFPTAQPPGTNVQTLIAGYVNGMPIPLSQGIGSDVVRNCQIPVPLPPTHDLSGVYNPGSWDGRANPDPADKVAVYCINTGANAGIIVVQGIDANANPFYLGEFKLNDLTRVSPSGISQQASDGQSVLLMRSS